MASIKTTTGAIECLRGRQRKQERRRRRRNIETERERENSIAVARVGRKRGKKQSEEKRNHLDN